MAAKCLEVTIGSTASLKENKAVNKVDPYAVLWFNGVEQRTDSEFISGARPVWNHRFNFMLPENDSDYPQEMDVHIWDKVDGVEKYMGSCKVHMGQVYIRRSMDAVWPVHQRDGKLLGHIRFHFSILVEDTSVVNNAFPPISPLPPTPSPLAEASRARKALDCPVAPVRPVTVANRGKERGDRARSAAGVATFAHELLQGAGLVNSGSKREAGASRDVPSEALEVLLLAVREALVQKQQVQQQQQQPLLQQKQPSAKQKQPAPQLQSQQRQKPQAAKQSTKPPRRASQAAAVQSSSPPRPTSTAVSPPRSAGTPKISSKVNKAKAPTPSFKAARPMPIDVGGSGPSSPSLASPRGNGSPNREDRLVRPLPPLSDVSDERATERDATCTGASSHDASAAPNEHPVPSTPFFRQEGDSDFRPAATQATHDVAADVVKGWDLSAIASLTSAVLSSGKGGQQQSSGGRGSPPGALNQDSIAEALCQALLGDKANGSGGGGSGAAAGGGFREEQSKGAKALMKSFGAKSKMVSPGSGRGMKRSNNEQQQQQQLQQNGSSSASALRSELLAAANELMKRQRMV